MNSKILIGACLWLGALTGQVGAQSVDAPLFENGRMLRPLVQDVLTGSELIDTCTAIPETTLELECRFDVSGKVLRLSLEDLLASVNAEGADPKTEILTFANNVLVQGDPNRVFPMRAGLRPILRSKDFVDRARENERLPVEALFPVEGFPSVTAFSVVDDSTTVHLVQDVSIPGLGFDTFDEAMDRAVANATWIEDDRAKLRCALNDQAAYCSIRIDGFYESSLLLLDDFKVWLREQISEPCFIAVPARDELLIVPLSNREAVQDLVKRLERLRPFAITHDVAYWSGGRQAGFEPVKSWSLRGGLLLSSRLTVRKEDGEVLVFSY